MMKSSFLASYDYSTLLLIHRTFISIFIGHSLVHTVHGTFVRLCRLRSYLLRSLRPYRSGSTVRNRGVIHQKNNREEGLEILTLRIYCRAQDILCTGFLASQEGDVFVTWHCHCHVCMPRRCLTLDHNHIYRPTKQ